MNPSSLLVACLCARWCGVCRDYGAVFEGLSTDLAGAADLAWIDIEDEAALLDDVEIENFPTLLIARAGKTLFFGPVTPQPATLARLVQSALHGDLPAAPAASEVEALSGRVLESLDRLRQTSAP